MVGERLRAARGRAQLSMRDVAVACEVSPQAVFKWEHDKSHPSSGKLLVLCKLLDVSLEWLMDSTPLDFHSTSTAPQGKHAKYWVRAALEQMMDEGLFLKVGEK